MREFITSPLFRFILFPLVSAIIGILIKIMSLSPQKRITKEDIAVAFPLMVASTLSFTVLTVSQVAQLTALTDFDQREALLAKLAIAPWILLAMVVSMCSLAFMVGRFGWLTPSELRLGLGITLPHTVAALYLIITMIGAV